MLQRMGIIDENKKPTDRAVRWREDATYPEVCNEILKSAFPTELQEAFPPPNPERAKVESWFRMTMQVGEGAASSMAKFYLMLSEADPSKQEEAAAQKAKPVSSPQKAAPPAKKATAEAPAQISSAKPPNGAQVQVSPGLHVNIEIHIAPDTPPGNIDQIFSSMAKHLKLSA
jgi:hypothetical protein